MSAMMSAQPFLLGDSPWTEVLDGNPTACAMFERHYTSAPYRKRRRPALFVGPGEKLVMLTEDVKALFVWRKFMSMGQQHGVNCAVFRNEGAVRSSDLIRAAVSVAWHRWPGERLYTYVNPRRVRSTNPGACFKLAGWRACGVTKKHRLVILELLPEAA